MDLNLAASMMYDFGKFRDFRTVFTVYQLQLDHSKNPSNFIYQRVKFLVDKVFP